jgi:para-aminobenzoate synthetase component I
MLTGGAVSTSEGMTGASAGFVLAGAFAERGVSLALPFSRCVMARTMSPTSAAMRVQRMLRATAFARPWLGCWMVGGGAMPFAAGKSYGTVHAPAVSMLQTSSAEITSPPPAGGESWRSLALSASTSQIASALAQEKGFIWLDSAVPGPGAVSLLTARPSAVITGHIDRDWAQVEALLSQGRTSGGLFGWVGFDGLYTLGIYESILRFEHDSGRWSENGPFSVLGSPLDGLETANREPRTMNSLPFAPSVSKTAYTAAVRRAQDYIAAGDIYQVNLSHPWHADWPAEAEFLPYYLRLREISPAPHAACLNLNGTTIMSASPELFLKMDGRTITTRPIKGTRPRFPDDHVRDVQSARDLLACEKERAELLMITDLQRNDLGQVCEYGSVETPDLWRVESFAQVYHLVSTVTGRLRPEMSHAAAFRACFPGGSITGAPKKRALEIIAELEAHPRGVYTGAIGYFGFDGTSQWNIAIRTAVQHGNEITFHAGSGIVADSIPDREWEETLHKASGILSAWS